MDGTTHRQFRSWMAWLEREWDRPSRDTQYLMQIAQVVRQGQTRTPGAVTLDQFRLRFSKPTPRDVATATANAKAAWLARVPNPTTYSVDKPVSLEEILTGEPGLFVPKSAVRSEPPKRTTPNYIPLRDPPHGDGDGT